MIARAKLADDFRGDPARFVTLTGTGRHGSRLTPQEARELAADLLRAADEADALPLPPGLTGRELLEARLRGETP